tara:strand:- start:4679 stop:6007 length:1329 start_codon:yes stop_codon:yes gene_type:complete
MSDSYEEFCNAHTVEHRVCGVAYTINDFQPVICTHIGDQPLYYLDEAEITEEEGLFDPAELGMLAEEIQTLKKEILGFDSLSTYIEEKTMVAFTEFSENMEDFNTVGDFFLSADKQRVRLEEIKFLLGESRLAAAFLDTAKEYNVKIMMSEQVEKAFYDRRSGTIFLYPHMDIQNHILLATRELRRHWQHRQGALINPLTFTPEHAILINRAQEADLAVSVIRIAWELQLAGKRDVWERVENSPLSDLARAYAREALVDFRTINNGMASAAIFEGWFLSERCRQKDKKIIQEMLADHNGYVFQNDQSSHTVTSELISALGEMPFGKNYLAQHAHIIMDDPIFMEVRDRSNANFLWFIKFERTFKEAEQDLQTDSDLSTHDVRHDLYNTKSQDQHNGITHTANIIQLFEHGPEKRITGTNSKVARQSGQGADVIDLQHWSGKR